MKKETTPFEKIVTENLTWTPSKKCPPVLENISEIFEKGEFYGILGPNGAGKTSLIRQLLYFIEETEGKVYYGETDVHDISRKNIAKNVAFLSQNIDSSLDFPVKEIVAMGREPYRRIFSSLTKEDEKIIEDALKYANCTNLADRPFNLLSGGERQRVMIARTIAQDTPWIILDEPLSNLDVKNQTRILSSFNKFRKDRNRTVAAVLHDLNIASFFCSRIIIMKNGKVVASGKTEEVMTPQILEEVYEVPFYFIERENQRPVIMQKYDRE